MKMKVLYKILIVIGSGILAAILGYFATWIKLSQFVPTRGNFLLFDASAFEYLLIPIIYFVCGVIMAITLLFIERLNTSLLISLFISFLVSYKVILHAVEIYNRPDVETAHFYRAVIGIISAFLIFPLIAYSIWVVRKNFINKYQFQ